MKGKQLGKVKHHLWEIAFVLMLCFTVCAAQSTTATGVYGQLGNFTTDTANKGGIGIVSANNLYQPTGLSVDSSGGLYVADFINNRIVYYSQGSKIATRVYGQFGSFIRRTSNNGGISADSLWGPRGVFVTSAGVYIVDHFNNRVLYYVGTSTTASRVYGQLGNFTTRTSNKGGISANSLNRPTDVFETSLGVYIADTRNARVLFYVGTSTTATRVYGQGGSFIRGTMMRSISANSLANPFRIFVTNSGVYIVDQAARRVLYYVGISTTATRVYGQRGSFVTVAPCCRGVSANNLENPRGVFATSAGVYIADTNNNRVLYYVGTSTTATRVYGQGGNFTTRVMNNGGISANSLNLPSDVFVYADSVYIADHHNNRVLQYPEAAVMTTAPNNAVTTVPTVATTSPSIASSLLCAPLVVMILLSVLC